MKKLLSISAAVAIVAMAGTALAAGSASLTVQANIVAACSVSAPTALNFGALDASAPGATATGNTTIDVNCTKGTTPTLTASATPTLSNGTDNIAYTLTFGAVAPSTGVTQNVAVTGDIAAGDFFLKSPGAYAATATIDVTP